MAELPDAPADMDRTGRCMSNAIASPGLASSAVINDIHPLFEKFEHTDCSPQVFKQLIAGLRLASLIFMYEAAIRYWSTRILGVRQRRRRKERELGIPVVYRIKSLKPPQPTDRMLS